LVNDVWVEVNLDALKHNLRQVRGLLAGNVKIMAVVKGNGFGHGYVEPSRAFIEAGADALAVTRLEEALPIRGAGITAPILLFAPIQAENAEIAIEADLDMTVAAIPLLRSISETASKLGKKARIHVKVETGMGRLGLQADEAPSFLQAAHDLPGIQVAGIYTHFATAADPDAYKVNNQLELFKRTIAGLKEAGFDYGLAHAANSAGVLRLPESHLDMVRPGTILYGQYPSSFVPQKLDLKPTWKLKARICEIKTVSTGTSIGYGAEYVTKGDTRIAILSIGYADGFTLVPEGPIYRQGILRFAARKMKRSLSVEIKGHKAAVIGRVAMQMCMIDITRIAGVKVGDEVTIPAMRVPTSALIPRVYV